MIVEVDVIDGVDVGDVEVDDVSSLTHVTILSGVELGVWYSILTNTSFPDVPSF
jgi:hypothetical protein